MQTQTLHFKLRRTTPGTGLYDEAEKNREGHWVPKEAGYQQIGALYVKKQAFGSGQCPVMLTVTLQDFKE